MNIGINKNNSRKKWRSGWRSGFAFLTLLLFHSAMVVALDPTSVSEYEVKAAYVYNFTRFIDWPTEVLVNPNAPIVIGVIGNNDFASILENMVKGKTVQSHPISVHVIKWPADVNACQIICISSYEQQRAKEIVGALQNLPILTITEAEKGSRSKGVINFQVEEGKVRFEIDQASAAKARLKISSKLLRLAMNF
jgi:hypothetical protein